MRRKGRAASGDGLGFQRVAFLFHSHQVGQRRVRNLTIVKPDEVATGPDHSLCETPMISPSPSLRPPAGRDAEVIRRPTFSELAWPDDPNDADLPLKWASSVTTQVLDWIWRAFDQLHGKHLCHIDLNQPIDQLERNLTRNHFVEIQVLFLAETDGFSMLIPVHEWPEMETRSPAPPNLLPSISVSSIRTTGDGHGQLRQKSYRRRQPVGISEGCGGQVQRWRRGTARWRRRHDCLPSFGNTGHLLR